MKQWLYEIGFVTAATWAIDAAVDHWAFGHHHSAYHAASLLTGLSVGAMFFLWRYRERQHYREMHAFELQRRARQHTISNKLHVIALRAVRLQFPTEGGRCPSHESELITLASRCQ